MIWTIDPDGDIGLTKKYDITAKTIRDLLVYRYAPPQWCIQFEVANGPGGYYFGSADAIAMNMWPSRGLTLHGFEIKVSRSDWLNELKKPEKSERFIKHVDYWWLVAPPHVALDSEIPPTWGWIKATPKRLRIHKDAPALFEDGDNESVNRVFVAALIRHRTAKSTAFREAVDREVKEKIAIEKGLFDDQIKSLRRRNQQLEEYQKQLSEALGLSQFSYNLDGLRDAERIKAAKRFLTSVGAYNLPNLESTAQTILDRVRDLRAALK